MFADFAPAADQDNYRDPLARVDDHRRNDTHDGIYGTHPDRTHPPPWLQAAGVNPMAAGSYQRIRR